VFNDERREKNFRQHWRDRLAHGDASFGGEDQEGAEATVATLVFSWTGTMSARTLAACAPMLWRTAV